MKKFVIVISLLLLILTACISYTVVGKNNVISEQEFKTIVENWNVLANSEFYHLMVTEEGRQLGLWNLEGYWRKNDNFLDERLRFQNPDKLFDFDGKLISKVSNNGKEFMYGNENVYLRFQLRTFELLPYQTYRQRVENMLMLIEQGIDTQWSIILPDLVHKSKEEGSQYITIENANLAYQKDFPQNMFVVSKTGVLKNTVDGNAAILATIPNRDMIGATVEQVVGQLGDTHIYVAARHDYPTYVTQDAKLVMFIIDDDVVERILVFDLMDDTCKLIQTSS